MLKQLSTMEKIIAAVMALIVMGAAGWFVTSVEYTAWDFRNNLWGPAHLLVQGKSPYRIEQLFSGSNSVWMPFIIGLLFPMGYLPQFVATNIWALMNAVVLLILVGTLGKGAKLFPFGAALLMVALFPPLLSHFVLGQVSLLMAAALLLIAYLLQHREQPVWWLIGLLTVVSVTKPQLALLPGIGVIFFILNQNGWPAFWRTVGWVFLISLISTLPLWVAYPDWVGGFQVALQQNPEWAQPGLFARLTQTLGGVGWVLWLVLLGASVLIVIKLWAHRPPVEAMIWTLALNVIVTPYVWSWDFVLMVPLLLYVFFSLERLALHVAVLGGYSLIWAGIVAIRLNTDNSDARFWWVSLAVVVLLVATKWVAQR